MIKYLKSTTLKNKTVLLRVDINVPLDEKSGKVADDFRIEKIIPTIRMLQAGGNKIILVGHLGRPEGWDKNFSLRPIAYKLAQMLEYTMVETKKGIAPSAIKHIVFYTGDITHADTPGHLASITNKDIILLENIRFYEAEEKNETGFAKQLSHLADAYVNDAFAVSHRKDASIVAITKQLPAYCGPQLEKEIKALTHVLETSKKPFVVMMGGIKISDKAHTLENLGKRADKILLGGGLANLFYLSKGYEIGLSRVEKEGLKTAWRVEKNYKNKIILPIDVVVANKNMDKDSIRVCKPYEVGKKELILDCGPKSILLFAQELKKARTIVWNGPLGHFEVKPFDTATMALARIVGSVSTRTAYGIVGGGETVDAIRLSHQSQHIDHVSTGGGAMLEFLAGKKLPGIEALK